MRNFPELLLRALGPAPEAAVFQRRRFVGPDVFLQVNATVTRFVDDKLHLVSIVFGWLSSFDLGGNVHCCNVTLAHRHMPHLGTIEVDAVAGSISALVTNYAHSPSHVDVAIRVRYSEI